MTNNSSVRAERPFNVKLEGGVWEVNGTTYCQEQLDSQTSGLPVTRPDYTRTNFAAPVNPCG
jgi:hypothetical protein